MNYSGGGKGKGKGKGKGEEEKGFLWKLPMVRTKQLGKLGPAFGIGVGCGVGVGAGLLGGIGIGPGIPGIQFGFGVGAGCGVGLGFGYGMGRGIAHDDNRKYSNVGKLFNGNETLPSPDDIGVMIDELVLQTKKVISATSKVIDKWRR